LEQAPTQGYKEYMSTKHLLLQRKGVHQIAEGGQAGVQQPVEEKVGPIPAVLLGWLIRKTSGSADPNPSNGIRWKWERRLGKDE